jgi:hypothetical protein
MLSDVKSKFHTYQKGKFNKMYTFIQSKCVLSPCVQKLEINLYKYFSVYFPWMRNIVSHYSRNTRRKEGRKEVIRLQ